MEAKFRVGDRVLCTDDGEYGNVTFVDTSQVGEYGEIWYEVLFDNGEETWLTAEQLELTDVDKKTAFLTELKALLERFNAEIVAHIGEDDTTYQPKPLMYIELGGGIVCNYENYKDCDLVEITPSNIFDYDKRLSKPI